MPQIELMMSDLPHTLYNHKKDKKVSQKDADDAEAKMREAYEKKKTQTRKQTYTVDEVFAGDADNG